jgi:hypothetical protein
MEPDAPRTPWLRYAWAATLGLSILALTYVLFDEDLGTSAPLFAEFTCRGELEVEIANGFHEPWLTTPSSAIYYKATRDGELVGVFMSLHVREAGGEWRIPLSRTDEPSEGFVYIPTVTNATEAYVSVKDTSGRTCKAESPIIRAADAPVE